MKTQHNRFKDAPWYPKDDMYVMVGGAGGIGSWTTVLLSRAGFKVIVHDFDILEEHNLGGQLYKRYQVRDPKVNALAVIVQDFCDEEIVPLHIKITEDTPLHRMFISAFDNMKARTVSYVNWLENFKDDPKAIFIDGRLNAEQMQILCVRGGEQYRSEQREYLSEYLFDDSAVEDAPCTFKQTSHAAAMIASHIVGFFTNHITNVLEGDDARTVPFFWEYFIPMDLMGIKNVANDTITQVV